MQKGCMHQKMLCGASIHASCWAQKPAGLCMPSGANASQKHCSLLLLPKEGKAIGRNKEKRRISGNKQKTERLGEWTACCGNQEHLRVGLVEVMRMRNEWNNLKGR